jgi:hemerythrin-like domain-containing protein
MKQLIGSQGPPADFDHPLEMLSACHERVLDRVDTLERLAKHLPEHGSDEQAQQAAVNVMRYFDSAGEHHHEDEERDLFPLLVSALPGDAAAAALVEQLKAEHVRLRGMWQALRGEVEAIARNADAHLDETRIAQFGALYRQHIELEERELLPLADRVLPAAEKAAIGASMAGRRGVPRA